jgi:hypothetical protein
MPKPFRVLDEYKRIPIGYLNISEVGILNIDKLLLLLGNPTKQIVGPSWSLRMKRSRKIFNVSGGMGKSNRYGTIYYYSLQFEKEKDLEIMKEYLGIE